MVYDECIPEVLIGVGEKDSNGGTQWKQQNRVYDANKVAIAVCTHYNPWYLIKEQNK